VQCAFSRVGGIVKRGVWEAGGFLLEFPVMSLGETQLRPTAMFFRNLASMVEALGMSLPAAKVAAERHNGYGAHFGCAHERNSLWDGGTTCLS
jgi:dihydroxyacid dehydratase/phosphogluconate dehydratase